MQSIKICDIKNAILKFAALLFLSSAINNKILAQCYNMIHAATDSVGWIQGSDNFDYRKAYYSNDTFVITIAAGGANNFIYNPFPATMYGTASSFSASFDFRIDSNSGCSDGLTFWCFTSGLFELSSHTNNCQ